METIVSSAAKIGKQMHILHLAIYKLSVQLGVDPAERPDFAVKAAGKFGSLDVDVTYAPWRRGSEWRIEMRTAGECTVEVASASGSGAGVVGWAGISLEFCDESILVTSGKRVSQQKKIFLAGCDLAAAKKFRSTLRWAHSLESLSSMWDMLDKEQEKLAALESQLQATA